MDQFGITDALIAQGIVFGIVAVILGAVQDQTYGKTRGIALVSSVIAGVIAVASFLGAAWYSALT